MRKILDTFNFMLNRYFLLAILLSFFFATKTKENSQINMIMKGKGEKNFINDNFYLNASQVFVNGISNDTWKKSCYLDNDEYNNITIIFDQQIESCENMFNGLYDILEIDLSNFNFSKVTNMDSMFNECSNLTKITFNKINTSLVRNMRQLFHQCQKLTSIDLSNFNTSLVTNMDSIFRWCYALTSLDVSKFDTSNVENMNDFFAGCIKLEKLDGISNFDTSKVEIMKGMFYYCYKLKYLDLSNFNTSLVTNFRGMFEGSNSLIYLNLFHFVIKNGANDGNIFIKTSPHLKICINDTNTKNLFSVYDKEFDCDNICFNNNIKVNLNFNSCVEYCNQTENIYEYNNICYLKCPSNTYPIKNEYLCLDTIPDGYYLDENYLYKKCSQNFKLIESKNKCIKNCDDDDSFIYEYHNKCYAQCPEGTIQFNKNTLINISYCKPNCTNELPYEIISLQECVKYCPFKYLQNNDCIQNHIDNQTIDNLIEQDLIIKNMEIYFTSEDYDTTYLDEGEDEIFESEDMTIVLTTVQNQNKNRNKNITIIDLGQCEELLRAEHNISDDESIYIKKIDVYEEGMKIPKIEYDIYYKAEKNLEKVNLSVCKDSKISLLIPIVIDENENIDILNISSNYYNDICYIASSNKGADISLNDRKKEFIEGNKTVCQDDCDFIQYNYTSQKAKCECKIKESSESFCDMKIDKAKLIQSLIDIKNIANIKLLICFKVLFNKIGIKNNIAFYIISLAIIFHIIVILIFYIYKRKIINDKIKEIYFSPTHIDLLKDNKVEKEIRKRSKKKKTKKISSLHIKKEKNNKCLRNQKKNKDKIKFNHNYNATLNLTHFNTKKNKKEEIVVTQSKEILDYNDEELNNLSYNLALKLDKRTYLDYYLSLIKTKNIFIFSFCYNKDYNSKIIKINLFFMNFMINYTINALFFNDETMHKIYVDEGSFDFIYQLPQIIYSNLISAGLSIPLEFFALTESDIIELKRTKQKPNLNKRVNKLKRVINTKNIFYFIISFIFLCCFWYYLCMFCAVYRNTQYHLIKDTLMSFGLSFINPFFIYLIPGIFRIASLSNIKNKRKYLYKLSQVFQMI